MNKPEGARESAYLRQENFYRRPHFRKILTVMSGLSLETCVNRFKRGAQTHTQTDTHRTKTVSPPFSPFTWRRSK